MSNQGLSDRRAGIDAVLTTLSIGLPLDQTLIGDDLLPPIQQDLDAVRIPVWGTEAFRIREDRVGDFSEPDKLDISVSTTLVGIDGHALMAPVSDRQELVAEKGPLSYDLAAQALQTVVSSMRLAREKMQADLITSTAIYTGSDALVNKFDLNALAHRWDDDANDPFADLIPVLESVIPDGSGMRPNKFWMGQPVYAALIQNKNIKNRIFGTTGPQPNPGTSQLENLLGLPAGGIEVGRGVSRTVSGAITKLWGKNAGLLYVPPATGFRIPAFGYTVEQRVFNGSSQAVFRFRDEKMGASGGEWLKRSWFYTPVSTFNASGALFYNAVA